jgi:hypothetical protein
VLVHPNEPDLAALVNLRTCQFQASPHLAERLGAVYAAAQAAGEPYTRLTLDAGDEARVLLGVASDRPGGVLP